MRTVVRPAAAGYGRGYHLQRHGHLLADTRSFRFAEALAQHKFGEFFSGQVLEVGCGVGSNISWKPGAVGVDVSHFALAEARHRGLSVAAEMDAERLAIASGSIDTVLFAHVLEHLAQPRTALLEAARVLRPGGSVVITLPPPQRRSELADQHLYCWGEMELANLLEISGFSVIHQQRLSFKLRRLLARVPIPLGFAVGVSRSLGRVGLAVRGGSSATEFITVGQLR
jgi:SAM-dependent methyltransferase